MPEVQKQKGESMRVYKVSLDVLRSNVDGKNKSGWEVETWIVLAQDPTEAEAKAKKKIKPSVWWDDENEKLICKPLEICMREAEIVVELGKVD